MDINYKEFLIDDLDKDAHMDETRGFLVPGNEYWSLDW